MVDYVVMAYNIEHMNKMFANDLVKQSEEERAGKIANVIEVIAPHVLGICEAANSEAEHLNFMETYLNALEFKLAKGVSRGAQNLVFYYRDPFIHVSTDDKLGFYDPWQEDLDNDGVVERFAWERKPLEVVFQIDAGGPKLRTILVHTKSKGVFSVVDLANFQKIALGNRKKLVAQATKLRERLDSLIPPKNPNPLPLIVMGDMNDGPGLDPFEATVGKSFVETVMGSVFNPDGIFHNVLWHMMGTSEGRKDLWTADFEDPIVNNPLGWKHRVWIDHILVSNDMLKDNADVRYAKDSGRIGAKNRNTRKASDHFPVYCTIQADSP